jgi:hypothetical protein
VAFVTLYEAYLEIDPELDMWKYFFRVRRPQDPEAELIISKGTVIRVKAGHGVDPYLEIPMPRSMKGWQKKWFYLKNDASAPLPMFTSGHPVPLPSWREGAAGKDLDKLQPLHEHLQQLRQEGLTGIHLLWTFFSCRIEPLQKQRTKMWAYPGSSRPNSPSSKELIRVVEAQIHKVLDLGVISIPGASPVPLRRGIASVGVSTPSPIPVTLMILSFHCAHDLVQGLWGGRADPLMDAVGREVRHASSEAMRAFEKRERDQCTASRVAKKQGTDVLARSVSSGEGEMERGAALPPPSPPHTTPFVPLDMAPLSTGSTVGER